MLTLICYKLNSCWYYSVAKPQMRSTVHVLICLQEAIVMIATWLLMLNEGEVLEIYKTGNVEMLY